MADNEVNNDCLRKAAQALFAAEKTDLALQLQRYIVDMPKENGRG